MAQDSNNHSVSPMKAALVGAAVGLGAAAVTAMAHKPTRDKVIKALDTWGNKVDDLKVKGKEKMDELAAKAKSAGEEAADQAQQAARRTKKVAQDALEA